MRKIALEVRPPTEVLLVGVHALGVSSTVIVAVLLSRRAADDTRPFLLLTKGSIHLFIYLVVACGHNSAVGEDPFTKRRKRSTMKSSRCQLHHLLLAMEADNMRDSLAVVLFDFQHGVVSHLKQLRATTESSNLVQSETANGCKLNTHHKEDLHHYPSRNLPTLIFKVMEAFVIHLCKYGVSWHVLICWIPLHFAPCVPSALARPQV